MVSEIYPTPGRGKDAYQQFVKENDLTEEEIQAMKEAEEKMYLPYDETLGINPQDDSFLQKPIWDLEHTPQEEFPLLLHYHPLHLYRYQVCKQADTVLAHYLFRIIRTKKQKRTLSAIMRKLQPMIHPFPPVYSVSWHPDWA